MTYEDNHVIVMRLMVCPCYRKKASRVRTVQWEITPLDLGNRSTCMTLQIKL